MLLMVIQLLSPTTDHEQFRKLEQKKRGEEQQEKFKMDIRKYLFPGRVIKALEQVA